jgi:hypothetical protein
MLEEIEIRKVLLGNVGYIRGWLRNLIAIREYVARGGNNLELQQMRHTMN